MRVDASHLLEPDLGPKSDHQIEVDRLSSFPSIPDHPDPDDACPGVLLSDRIANLCEKYKMIYPFADDCLKAASYELGVGDWYGLRGKQYRLQTGESVTIEPFEVAIIQTLETLNLPRFLIARWNLRVRWVYKGLLWVGAPQVDPGFRGFLSFPLYNLSNKSVSIAHGERVAAMDFVMTTPVAPGRSKAYPWASRTRMVFSDYEKDQLESALATLAKDKIEGFEKTTTAFKNEFEALKENIVQGKSEVRAELTTVQSRIDNYTILTFTIIAVLFAALGLALSRSPETSFWSSSAMIAGISLWFALRSFYLARVSQTRDRTLTWLEIAVGLGLTCFLLFAQYQTSKTAAASLVEVRATANQAKSTADDAKKDADSRKEIDTRIDALQRQIDTLRNKKP